MAQNEASRWYDARPSQLSTRHDSANHRLAPRSILRFGRDNWPDFLFATLVMAAYVLWIYCFRYRELLAEDDLYRMLVGLLDGARYGTYLASGSHYGKAFSFGYIVAIYRFADARTLADPQLLIGFDERDRVLVGGGRLFLLLAVDVDPLRPANRLGRRDVVRPEPHDA